MTSEPNMTGEQSPVLSYRVRGSGPPLLLAHGGGGGIDLNFGPILAGLADRFTVLGPDYPGSGDTPRGATPLTLDLLADALVATADAAGFDQFGLAALSMGCPVAIRTTTRHPDRVSSLALIAGFAKPDGYLRLALDVWESLLDGDRDTLAKFLVMLGAGEEYVNSLPDSGIDQVVREFGALVPPGSAEHVALAKTIDVRAELPDIAVPTLVVKTTRDRLACPRNADELADGIPSARLVELDSGHSPAAARPEQLLEHLVEHFIGRA